MYCTNILNKSEHALHFKKPNQNTILLSLLQNAPHKSHKKLFYRPGKNKQHLKKGKFTVYRLHLR